MLKKIHFSKLLNCALRRALKLKILRKQSEPYIRRGSRPREGCFRPVPLAVPYDHPLLSG